MASEVWICTIIGNTDFYGDPLSVVSAPEAAPRVLEVARENARGQVFDASDFPKEMRYTDPKTQVDTLPDVFVAGDYVGVSEAAAAALRCDDLGACSLFPVAAFQADGTTDITGQFFLVNYGNVKSGGFLPGASKDVREDPFRPDVWSPRQWLKDGHLAVSSSVLQGPGIWVDDRLEKAFFLSGEIVRALRKVSNFPKLQLRKCSII